MRRALLPLLLLLAAPASAEPAVPVSSVYLVQDSGWMEPFYADASVPFRPLLAALVAASDAGGDTVVAAFDQDGQVPGRRSPDVLYRGGDDPAAVSRAIASLALPRQADGHLADADFDGALVGGIERILAGRPGIVWMVTNNRNSPGNSQRVDENTRDFASRLGNSAALPVVVAYPLRLPARGSLFVANGLIVYGIAYGQSAADALRRITRSAAMTRLFSDPAVQLKPLDQAPLVFTPRRVLTPGVSVARGPDGTLRIDGIPGGRASTVEIAGDLRSDYYPHAIDQARLSLDWVGPGPVPGRPEARPIAAQVLPGQVRGLLPGQSLPDVRIRLDVPAIARAPGMAGWLQKDVLLQGTLRLSLDDLSLSLEPGFSAKMGQIAALDQLPSVFFDNRKVDAASALLPVALGVRFPVWPLVLALGGLFGLLLLLAALLLLLRRQREHVVTLGGQVRRVRLRAFETRILALPGGRSARLRGRLFGPPHLVERDADAAR